jgi:hypothetical protein
MNSVRRAIMLTFVVAILTALAVVSVRLSEATGTLTASRRLATATISGPDCVDALLEQTISSASPKTLAVVSSAVRERHAAIQTIISLYQTELTTEAAAQYAKLQNEQSAAYLWALSEKASLASQELANIATIRSIWKSGYDKMLLDVCPGTGVSNPSSFTVSYIGLVSSLAELTPTLFPSLVSPPVVR